jgi:hypothetical protein
MVRQAVSTLFAALLVMAGPSAARADFTVSVRSLRDVFLGNETGQAFINALAANPVTVTVTDVQGVQPPVVSTFNAAQLRAPIRVPTGGAQTIAVTFDCPGLRTARLDAVINIVDATFEVAMPQDAGACPPPCPVYCPCPAPAKHGCFRRR